MTAKGNLGVTPFIWMFIFLLSKGVEGQYTVLPNYDICNPDTPGSYPPTVYLDVNATTEIYVDWPAENRTDNYNCLMLFRSCPSCQIRAEAVGSFSYPLCQSNDLSHIYNGGCANGCIYFQIFDADYQSQTTLRVSKSVHLNGYSSQSRQLHVVACGDGLYNTKVDMRLRLSVKKKEMVFNLHYWSNSQIISSPYFPNPYTLNSENYTYIFRAREQARFTIMFSDWLISPYSYVQFYNANIVNQISGAMRRPYIASTGPYMTMVFNTGPVRNTGMRLGFRATATYRSTQSSIPNVITDCDKKVTTSGGTLRLSSLITDGQYRDCIWIIQKPASFEGIRVNVLRLQLKYGGDEEIEIKEGLTSRGRRKLFADGGVLNSGEGERSTFESLKGFYIRLKGHFDDPDAVVITYASYYFGCSPYPPAFTCDNRYCIEDFLTCDGYDHCGDNSDEARNLCGYPITSGGRRAPSHSISVGVIIPIVVSVVLIIAMCLVIIFIRRCRKLNNETYGSAHSGRHPGNSRGRRHRRRGRNVQMSVTVSSGEHPPSYQEVMQTSPNGQLNMAFSWSGTGSALIQPPSYEEAIGNTSSEQPASDLEQARNSESLTVSHEGRNERAIDVGPGEGLDSLLAPNSYVSSSSSSEDLSVNHMDTSSSSDSSLDNNNSFALHRHGTEPERPATQDLFVKEGDAIVKEEGKRVALVDSDVDILSSPSSVNKIIQNHDANESMHQEEESNIDNQQEKQVMQENYSNENKTKEVDCTSQCDNKNTIDPDRGDSKEEVSPVQEQFAEGSVRPKETISYRENERVGSNEGIDFGHGNDVIKHMNPKRMYRDRENNGRYKSTEVVEPDRDNWHGSYTGPANHRSRSLADLSYGASRGLAVAPGHLYGPSETDKRFSYAGTGDTTFRNGRRDPYRTGTLVQDNPVKSLYHFLPQQENMPGENSAMFDSCSRSDQKMRKNSHLPQGSDPFDKIHASHNKSKSSNLQGSQLMSSTDPRSNRAQRPKTLNQQEQTLRHEKPSTSEEMNPSSSSSSSTQATGHQHSWKPSGYNGRSAQRPSRGPSRGYEESNCPEYHSTNQSLERTRPRPPNNDFSNHTDRDHSSNASSGERRPTAPRPSVRRSRQKNRSSALPTEPSARRPASSHDDTRPRPAPRRSVVNSSNANSNERFSSRGMEFQSTSTPLTVINYVATTENGGVDGPNGNQETQYPLAQLVFKTTNDDVFI